MTVSVNDLSHDLHLSQIQSGVGHAGTLTRGEGPILGGPIRRILSANDRSPGPAGSSLGAQGLMPPTGPGGFKAPQTSHSAQGGASLWNVGDIDLFSDAQS